MAKSTESKLTVLAFEKRIVASDGYMYATTWEKRNTMLHPISLVEKSVRGTQSQRSVKTEKVATANIQTVDSAALAQGCDTLKVKFSLKFLSHVFTPSSCNLKERYEKIIEMGEKYIEVYGFKELAKRYAINIVNGRYLWRNRFGAEDIEVVVRLKGVESEKTWTFDAYEFSLKSFDISNDGVLEIAQVIENVFTNKQDFALFEIEANVKIGDGQEIYPSEELIPNKDKSKDGKKSKVLYQVNNIAAMHSQKLNNAIRTIDTWYGEYDEKKEMPIAIEPYGAVTNLGKAFRSDNKSSFYGIFDKSSPLGELPGSEEEAHYLAAILIRGGVFGESSKE